MTDEKCQLTSNERLPLPHRLRQNATSIDCLADPDPALLLEAAAEIDRLREVLTFRNLTPNATPEQFKAVLRDHEKGRPVNAVDLVNALMWRLGNQRREIAKLRERLPDETPAAPPYFIQHFACAGCGVANVDGARHFSGCPYAPGELARPEKARETDGSRAGGESREEFERDRGFVRPEKANEQCAHDWTRNGVGVRECRKCGAEDFE